MKNRSLVIDGGIKEMTTGPAHDVTNTVFVRVTFDVPSEPKFTFTVRSQAVDLAREEDEIGEN